MTWTRLPLSRSAVDRGAERRGDPTLISGLLGDARTRVLMVRGALVPLRGGPVLDLRGPSELGERTGDVVRWLYLGSQDDVGYLAAVLSDDAAADSPTDSPTDVAAAGAGADRWALLRDVGAALSGRDAGLATMAVGLVAWHRSLAHCPRCGAGLLVEESGWLLRCPLDASAHYPRTDPAVIVALVDASDRLLLAHATQWSPLRFSTVAGFVEPGESAEQAVRREVAEETGVRVGAVAYLGSQPWPFPASLMLAFRAAAETTEVTADGVELSKARWFTRAELSGDVDAGRVTLPGRTSIARLMIEDWFGGTLPGE
jgi:NAD+ diphosphatase